MSLRNTELFEECLDHPEPLVDPFYCQDGLIISDSPAAPSTPLMEANSLLLARITAADVALRDGDTGGYLNQIDRIMPLLETENINFTELTSFFPTLDVSYSIYRQLAPAEKRSFLVDAVRLYIEKRHRIYQSHGYSPTTLQVRKDFEKHKTGGSAANRKVESILRNHEYQPFTGGRFADARRCYLFADATSLAQQVHQELCADLGLEFAWRREHQDKSIDLFWIDGAGHLRICEFKHMKESGGGQDKQLAELIALIRHGEAHPRLGYVAFLDGIYFNSFIDPGAKKTREQVRQIRQHLKENPANYFVNTHGLNRLLAPSIGSSSSGLLAIGS
jgi:hypothetical protein